MFRRSVESGSGPNRRSIRRTKVETRDERSVDEKMMAIIGKVNEALSMSRRKFGRENRFCWSSRGTEWKESGRATRAGGRRIKAWIGMMAGIAGSCGAILYYLDETSVKALQGAEISPPRYPWAFNGISKTFDHAALRRGWLVYRTVCRTCHSLKYVRFLDLVGETHTLEEANAIASEFEVEDGPDDQGNYYTRPAKLTDRIPSPFPNEQAARAANFGTYPPDLTYAVLAQKRGIDYTFALLTGWMDPPAGVYPEEGQFFNVYFPNGFTSMPQMFYEGMVEYDDGTPATQSQMAKDVVEFLSWTAAPEHDTRKIMTLKATGVFLILIATIAHLNRRSWSHVRSRRMAYTPNCISGQPQLPRVFQHEHAAHGSKKSGALSSR